MKNKKKGILFVIGSYHPEITGGSIQTRLLIKILKDKFNFFVLTTTKKKNLRNTKNIYRINYKDNSFFKILSAFNIINYFIKNSYKFQIIYMRGFTKKNFLIILLGKFFKKKIIYSPTRYEEDDIKSLKKKYPIYINLLNLCDKFIVISDILSQKLNKKIKKTHLSCFVDTKKFLPRKKNNKIPIILAVGFFSKTKNTKLTYIVWRDLFLKGFKSKIIFVGKFKSDYYLQDNEIYNFIKKNSKQNNIDKYLNITGEVKNIHKYYNMSDIFVLPSVTEGFAGSILEAMATKNACIITNLTGINNIYVNKFHCLKFKKNSYKEYYLSLKSLIKNKKFRKKISINGYNLVKSKFDINLPIAKKKIINAFTLYL